MRGTILFACGVVLFAVLTLGAGGIGPGIGFGAAAVAAPAVAFIGMAVLLQLRGVGSWLSVALWAAFGLVLAAVLHAAAQIFLQRELLAYLPQRAGGWMGVLWCLAFASMALRPPGRKKLDGLVLLLATATSQPDSLSQLLELAMLPGAPVLLSPQQLLAAFATAFLLMLAAAALLATLAYWLRVLWAGERLLALLAAAGGGMQLWRLLQ